MCWIKMLPLQGNIWANLKVATTGTDADWVVKVIDVYPDDAPNNNVKNRDGSTKEVYMGGLPANGTQRSHCVASSATRFDKPEPFVPGQVSPGNLGVAGHAAHL
jgi:predicted acyl esterase